MGGGILEKIGKTQRGNLGSNVNAITFFSRPEPQIKNAA
jgi:hypothetical protein